MNLLQKFLGKKEPEPAATPEEIKQLKLDLERAELRKKIAVVQATMPKKQNKLLKILKTTKSRKIRPF